MKSSFDELLSEPLSHRTTVDWEKALYLMLVVLAIATRLWGLGIRVQSHDESLHTKYSWNLYAGQGFQHTPLMHGPFLFHATALSYFLFGDNDFSARLVVALLGVALVAFPYFLRSWLGRVGALVASFLLLISPSIGYYSRYIRHDIPIILWSLIVVFAILSYLRDGRDQWLYLMAAGVSLMFATKEVAFIYNAIFGFFLVGLFARQAVAKDWGNRESLKALLGIALAVAAVGLLILSLGTLSPRAEQGSSTALPWWALASGALAALAMVGGMTVLLVGTWHNLSSYRSLDLIIVLGTLCLPFLSPIPIKLVGLDPVNYDPPTIYYSGAITAAVLAVSVVVGILWNWRRWSIVAAIHYAIFIVLFTTVFTNGTGIASGLVGSMGYWLAQQGVQRGDQPWYYYGIMVPLYEYLPLFLSVVTTGFLAIRSAVRRPGASERLPGSANSRPRRAAGRVFVPFVLWWVGMAWVIYSYAGEKMPWLTVHLALPMILLGSWGLGQFIEAINWRQALENRLWIPALLLVPLVMAIGMLIHSVSSGPFQGPSDEQLTVTGEFLGSLVAVVGFGAGLVYVIRQHSSPGSGRLALSVALLVMLIVPILLTIRHSWHFCFINYGYPIEHLVYAHSAPAVKETMDQIEELSRRVVGGPKQIKIAYGADGSWPFHWYLRDYDNAVFYGENPTREQMDAPVVIAGRQEWDKVAPYMANDYLPPNTYTFLWWPMEDYKGLTWDRIRNALSNPQMRAALWNIWYDRDYGLYDEVTGKNHTLDAWPLRSEYRLYIRRDIIAQIWDRGYTGPKELEDLEPYSANRLELAAREVFGSQGSGEGEFQSPRGIAVGPDGSVYVADAGNHRIQKFTADGELIDIWGGRSLAEEELGAPQGFNEPWDVAVAPDSAITSTRDNSVYVADTWNHRIQRLDDQGNAITAWGFFGEFGPEDGEMGQSAFYGPRGVAVAPLTGSGADPLVYVTDTGNKRVQVFGSDGAFSFQWGGAGMAEGHLEEPVGIAFGPEGDLYIADTWNRRVQLFDKEGGFLRQWTILGWDTDLPEEKPYLAVDDQGRVYVTDPGHYRVLVFNSQGEQLASFGRYGTDNQSFSLPQGIAVAADGTIYVTDAHAHRVLVFDPIDFEQLDE